MKALITDIKRLAVHDGDGIRTTVFFKGCPLKCVWCHNPESIDHKPQLAYYSNKCIGCGECISICPSGVHQIIDGVHSFDRCLCISCGKCESVCLGEALTCYGREMEIEELLPLLLEDRKFYEDSGGGVTLSGGECLIQLDFCVKLLKRLKQENIHTAVDTCGFVPQKALETVSPYTDVFLYDIKAFDEIVHVDCTGHSNKVITENLRYIDALGKNIEIRIPYVPGHNDSDMEKIAVFLSDFRHITKIRILPYHNYAGSKYVALGMINSLPPRIPTNKEIGEARDLIRSITGFIVPGDETV